MSLEPLSNGAKIYKLTNTFQKDPRISITRRNKWKKTNERINYIKSSIISKVLVTLVFPQQFQQPLLYHQKTFAIFQLNRIKNNRTKRRTQYILQ